MYRSGAYLQDCTLKDPTAAAQDPILAKKLWDLTEKEVSAAMKAAGL